MMLISTPERVLSAGSILTSTLVIVDRSQIAFICHSFPVLPGRDVCQRKYVIRIADNHGKLSRADFGE
jgi:hypothetical protein